MAQEIQIIGAEKIQKKLFALEINFKNSKEALNNTGKYLVTQYIKNFEEEGSNVTGRWQELSPRTIAEKVKLGYGGKKILERTGRLRKSIQVLELNKFLVKVGSRLDYYKQHQLGDRGKNLPQRIMVGLNTRIVTDIMETLRTAFFKNFTR